MTTAQKKFTLAVLIAVLGAIAAPLLGAAWGAKVDTSTYDLHVEQEGSWRRLHVEQDRTHAVRDSAERAEQRALLLDVLCGVKTEDRRCR
jgi:hypothetical protein